MSQYITPSGAIVDQETGQVIQGPGSASYNNGIINSSTLSSSPTINYQSPNPTAIYPVSTLTTPPLVQTEPEKQASDLTTALKDLNNNLVGKSAYQAGQEESAGIPGLKTTLNDLTSKLTGLKNEALAIPQQLQLESTGRGITAAGLQPIQTGFLRNNAIQSLGVASLLEAAQGRLSSAQALVDRAVAQKYDPIKEEIAAKTANLDLILKSPAYSVADKNRAQAQKDIQDANLRALTKEQEDFKTGQAMAVAAVKLNQGNQQALLASQQVLALDPKDPQYLTKAFQLVGQYQSDPVATKKALLENQKLQADINKVKSETGSGLGLVNGNVNGIPFTSYVDTTRSGKKYVDANSISDKKEQTAVVNAARAQGIPVVNKDEAEQLTNIDVARENADKIANVVSNFLPKDASSRIFQGPLNKIKDYFQTDADISSYQAYRSAAIEAMRAMAGSKGLRINQAEIKLAQENDIPKITDTVAVANAKLDALRSQLQSWEDVITRANGSTSEGDTKVYNGVTYKVVNGNWVSQ